MVIQRFSGFFFFDEKDPTIFIRTHNTDLKNRLTAPYREERRRAASEAAKNEKKGFRASLIVALAAPPRW